MDHDPRREKRAIEPSKAVVPAPGRRSRELGGDRAAEASKA